MQSAAMGSKVMICTRGWIKEQPVGLDLFFALLGTLGREWPVAAARRSPLAGHSPFCCRAPFWPIIAHYSPWWPLSRAADWRSAGWGILGRDSVSGAATGPCDIHGSTFAGRSIPSRRSQGEGPYAEDLTADNINNESPSTIDLSNRLARNHH